MLALARQHVLYEVSSLCEMFKSLRVKKRVLEEAVFQVWGALTV